MNINKGSEWRKWDLHVHSPKTFLNNQYKNCSDEEFIKKIKEAGLSCIGLTNYLKFEDDFWSRKKKLEKNGIAVFPNLEFRLTYQNKDDDCCDLHVIFNPNIEEKTINDLLGTLKVIVDEKEKIIKNLDSGDFKKAVVEFEELIKSIKNFPPGLKDSYAIGSLSRGKGNSRSSSVYEKVASESHFMIHSSDTKGNIGEDKKYWVDENGKLLLQSSDAHRLSDIGKKFTWIKADPTFEGLRQAIFDPKSRSSVEGGMPKEPINSIKSIKLNIPEGTKANESPFCFAGSDKEYHLSPYLNCFIGGRGSGKSTILNFLGQHSKNPNASKEFWSAIDLSNVEIEDAFSFDGTEDFEFLAQSEIEEFAGNKKAFTQAIYDRANARTEDELTNYEKETEASVGKLDQAIQDIFNLKKLKIEKREKEKEKETLEKSVEIQSSDEFKELSKQISEKTKEQQELQEWKGKVSELRKSLQDACHGIEEEESIQEDTETHSSKYKEVYTKVVKTIRESLSQLDSETFTEEKKKEKNLEEGIIDLEDEVKELFEKSGYTDEDIEQMKSAPKKIQELSNDLRKIKTDIQSKESKMNSIKAVFREIKKRKEEYEKSINDLLAPLQKVLGKEVNNKGGENIKPISLEYSFNDDNAWESLAKEFYEKFKDEYEFSQRETDVCNFIVKNKKVFKTESLGKIKTLLEEEKDLYKYVLFLRKIFEEKENFTIFRTVREKHLNNVKEYKVINVKYDDKDIEDASFGQKCTAVIVILLLFGNNPLIIDEPETHLDSALIANYLVHLLKNKKTDRQVIFATHNANLVINGDAEKIFILKDKNGKTEIVETTIENLDNREELLKLEGGKEAFEKRGKKLDIK